jgi:cytochrome P450
MPHREEDRLPTYDPERLRTKAPAILVWLSYAPFWVFWLLRSVPILRLFGWAAVFRYDEVAEVLSRHDVFRVPFGEEIARLNDGAEPGTPFILGIDDRWAHDLQQKRVMEAFRRDDVEKFVAPISFDFARDVIRNSKKRRIDAIGQLITAVPVHLCGEYYGVDIPDLRKFAYATLDVSRYLFGPPPMKPTPAVDEAAAYVRAVVDQAIDRAFKEPPNDNKVREKKEVCEEKVLPRLVRMLRDDPKGLKREHIRAFLLGMIIGFVPTNTIAGGHILEMLLSRQEFLEAARQAAEAGDDDLLKHTLFEAMRFMPLNFGPFRVCSRDYTVAADTSRSATISKGTKVLASTMSAMFDSRQVDKPREFNPRRPASDYMLFGYGMHWCAGVFIAQAQITQTFKALVVQQNLKRAGKLVLRELFPDRLEVEWD